MKPKPPTRGYWKAEAAFASNNSFPAFIFFAEPRVRHIHIGLQEADATEGRRCTPSVFKSQAGHFEHLSILVSFGNEASIHSRCSYLYLLYRRETARLRYRHFRHDGTAALETTPEIDAIASSRELQDQFAGQLNTE